MTTQIVEAATLEEFEMTNEVHAELVANRVVSALNDRLLKDGKQYLTWPLYIDNEIKLIVNNRFRKAGWGGVLQRRNGDDTFTLTVYKK